MEFPQEKFKIVLPAVLEKGKDGEDWRVYGLASTPRRDQQGEIVNLQGLDLAPIEKGKGVFNFDHKKGPENTVGVIDKYKKTEEGLYLGGYLFKNHDRAKAIYQIMSSLKKSDRGRIGMSVEGVIKKREGEDGKTIAKAVITACAITMNPVNEDTYADLEKSMPLLKSFAGVEFESDQLSDSTDVPAREELAKTEPKADVSLPIGNSITFTAEQVAALLSKALGVGAAYATSTPANLSGGDALAQESLDSKKKKKKVEKAEEMNSEPEDDKSAKKLKKGDTEFFKSQLDALLTNLQKLYPDVSRSELWETVKERLNRKFSELSEKK